MQTLADQERYQQQFDDLCARLCVTPDSRGECWIDCPWCGKDKKHFSFSERGYNCFVCSEGRGKSLSALAERLDLPRLAETRQQAPRRAEKPREQRAWQNRPEMYLDRFCAALDRVTRWQAYKPLTLDSIARWRLGVGVLPSSRCAHRRLIVPVLNDGQIVAFHGRAFSLGDTDAKWLTSGGSSKQVLFNADLLRPGADVIICENYVDTILAMQEEPSAVAVCGGGASWQSAWTAQIAASRPRQVLIWLDHDLAGNGSRYHYRELVADWRARNPKAQRVPAPAGPEIANELLSAGVRGRVFEWPKGTPPKADLGWYLMNERRAA